MIRFNERELDELAAALFLRLPVGPIALAIAEHGEQLGLVWRLRPATVGPLDTNGQVRITYDGDTVMMSAVSLIGRLPVGARVMAIMSPPSGHHIVGFLGADFPAQVSHEAIGRPQLVYLTGNFSLPVSSTTLTAVTGMSFQVAPNSLYVVRLRASNSGDTAADCKYSWSVPSGTNFDRYAISLPTAETTNFNPTTWSTAKRIASDSQANANTAASPPSTAFPGYWEDILVRSGSTPGTCQLMAAQAASSATPTLVLAQSYMEVQRYAST